MSHHLDHLFICVSIGAPEADRLAAFGLTEGTPNSHPGQGTACRRFFFRNAYLERLWVNKPAEAHSEGIRLTHLWERWAGRTSGVCPGTTGAFLAGRRDQHGGAIGHATGPWRRGLGDV